MLALLALLPAPALAQPATPSFSASVRLPERWTSPEGIEFRLLPAGPQRVGYRAPRGPGEDFIVWISKPYYLQLSELSQGQWQAIGGGPEPAFCAGGQACGPDYPVHSLDVARIEAVIARLNSRTGLPYRLPTRPEWERAASGGNWRSRYFWGDDPALLPRYENCGRPAGPWWQPARPAALMPVGSFRPNPYGFYDLLGNVSELLSHSDELWVGDRLEPARQFAGDVSGYLRAYTDFPHQAPAGAPVRDGAGGNYRRLAPACELSAGSGLRQVGSDESDAPAHSPGVGFRLLLPAEAVAESLLTP